MKILLTGASSFTGYWFARSLVAAGHSVCATLTRDSVQAYGDDVRARRVIDLQSMVRYAPGCRFGDDRFLALIGEVKPDVLCHHAADVTDYKSPDFDVNRAVANNTHRLPIVLRHLQDAGANRVVLTGSVFEGGEGAGSEGLPHFSAYGLSKALAAESFRFYCKAHGISLGKFVIPNPFGPMEEPRFTAYLMKNWFAGKTPSVNTPAYVRDNIHISLMALSYVKFIEQMPTAAGYAHFGPSGYVESQGAFAQRFAREMSGRLNLACHLDLKHQTEFTEPRIRLNTDPVDGDALGWNESAAWDEVAAYYRELHAISAVR